MLDSRLRYLVAVAGAGSFTAGAEAMGVTQSAVTKSVADLEKQVGYPIFTRTARGVVLTERGSYFAERAGMLLNDAQDLLSPDAHRADRYAGVLRIGVGPASLEWVLVDVLTRLRRQHPGMRFEVSGSSFDRVIQQVRSGAIDVAIGLDSALADWPDLVRQVFGSLHARPFVRAGHPLAAATSVVGADLANYEFISPSISRPYGEIIRSLYTDRGVAWQSQVHEVDYFPVVKRLVATSDAIGVIAAPYAELASFRKEFAVLEGVDLFPSAPLSCAVRAQREAKPATRALIAMMKITHADD